MRRCVSAGRRVVGWAVAAAVVVGLCGGTAVATEDALPRRGSIGLGVQPAPGGVAIMSMREGGAAANAGLKVGDVLRTLGGKPVADGAALQAMLKSLPGGSTADAVVVRDGVEQTIRVTMSEHPREVIEGSEVRYGSVRLPAGYRLRTILTMPQQSAIARDGKAPAFFFVQGLICQTIDRPQAPDATDTRLVHAMAKAGYATLRVDKAGMGDSEGPDCGAISFSEELAGYNAALDMLRTTPGIDPDRIYVFGHSMGGVMAPYVMAHAPVRGAIVYGTAVKPWFEYTIENLRRQATLQGASPAEVNEMVQAESRRSALVLLEKKTLGEVWRMHPELRNESPMASEDRLFTRSMSFFHQLQDLNLAQAWSVAPGDVLAIHGEYDWVTAFEDHRIIAEIANTRSPGSGRAISLSGADHGFTTHPTLEASLSRMGQGTWDQRLPVVVQRWIDQVEGRAPMGELLDAKPGA